MVSVGAVLGTRLSHSLDVTLSGNSGGAVIGSGLGEDAEDVTVILFVCSRGQSAFHHSGSLLSLESLIASFEK